MPKKYIVLDTETTGLEVKQGHRIIEIGAVLVNNRVKSDQHFHSYLNPQRSIDEKAYEVHGISLESLEDKPLFEEVAEDFIQFVEGSTLVIHNAPFDLGFLNNELKLASSKYPKLEEICEVEDSLEIAREKHPGQRISLDALASKYNVSGYDRTFHGALLDANILADVYMQLTGGQSKFEFASNSVKNTLADNGVQDIQIDDGFTPVTIESSKDEILEHEKKLSEIETKYDLKTIWRKFQ
tara:strand:- start:348 stop:1067 length:720 start_codon:yes stop_codon:yes gene_type:complete